jgi:hypothetical protein
MPLNTGYTDCDDLSGVKSASIAKKTPSFINNFKKISEKF